MRGVDDDVLLSLEDVSFSYPVSAGLFTRYKIPVASDLSFSLRRGERLGIVGLNGEGKSTLLRLIAGVIEPDAGRIVRKKNVSIALLALGVGFNPFLTGRDNAILSAVLMGRDQDWAQLQLPKIRSFSELGDAFDRPVRTYSAGMRARLAFSVALNMEVDVLLIDEVLAVGDANFRAKAALALNQKLGKGQTMVLVSHSSSEIKRVCNRAIWLSKGCIQEMGDPDDVVSAYEVFT
jgi:lipopolysaccharide transport system ATP-binding protein